MKRWPNEWVSLPGLARRLLIASAVRSLGTGLILPLLVAYLNRANGFDLRLATTALAFAAGGAVAGNPLSGWLSDRAGRNLALSVSLVTSAVGAAGYAVTTAPWHALVSATVLGIGIGGASGWYAVLAESVRPERRGFVFGTNYALNNIGLGAGGVVGGLIADASRPLTFRFLYAADAVALLVVAVAVARTARPALGGAEPVGSDATGDRLTTVLRNPAFLLLLAIGFLVFAVGYSQIESGLIASLLATTVLDTRAFGIVFAVNTVVVVVSQVVLTDRWAGAEPARLLRPVAVVWAAAWLLVLLATRLHGYGAPLAVASAGGAVFAVGEALYAMSMPTLVNQLTGNATRGRANAVQGLATSVGFIAGPLVAGSMIGAGAVTSFVLVVVAGCLVAALLALFVRAPMPARDAVPVRR